MAKKLLAVMLGFAFAPAFIAAEHTVGSSIVGSTCLVRIYHTNINTDGGKIVTIGDELFFWRNNLPECQNILPGGETRVFNNVANTLAANTHPAAYTPAPVYSAYNTTQPVNLKGRFDSFWGDPCAIKIYHVDINFPPEGGRIIQVGDELYFVRSYKPGCENVGLGGGSTVVSASNSAYNPLNSQNGGVSAVQTYQPTQVPVYRAPNTGSSTCY